MTITIDIPKGWKKVRLKRIANLNPSKNEVVNLPEDTEVTFLPMEAVSESWKVDYSRTRPLAELRNGYTYFRDSDILIAKITPCFENGKGALVDGCLNGFGFGTTEFHVIHSPHPETTRFLSYVIRSHRFMIEGAGMMTGTAGQKRLSDDYVKNFEMFLPPLQDQEKIARFLDRKTAAIDTLVAKKKRLIQLLEEKRTALINQAVTKGLNPNAPMKDSGIPWIGEIPEHWNIVRIGYFAQVGNGSTPKRDNADYWSSEGFPWLNSSKINEEIIYNSDQYVSKRALEECHLPVVPPKSILVAITGEGQTRGRSAMLKLQATINQHLAYIRIIDSHLHPEYLWRQLQAAYQWLRSESSGGGSTRAALTCEFLKEMKVPMLPLEEQVQIIHTLDEKIQEINCLAKKTADSIEKLQEYRRSLITAVVTGKLAVDQEDAA